MSCRGSVLCCPTYRLLFWLAFLSLMSIAQWIFRSQATDGLVTKSAKIVTNGGTYTPHLSSSTLTRTTTLTTTSSLRLPGTSTRTSTRNTAGPIPLHLFQTDVSRPDDAYIEKWTLANPGLQYTFMDDVMGREYLRTSWGEEYAEAFDSLLLGAIRADFLRLCFIAENGGFYADTDACPGEMSLIEMRAFAQELIVSRQKLTWKSGGKLKSHTVMWNAFFAATPRHPAILDLVHRAFETILIRYADKVGIPVLGIAGPLLMKPLLFQNKTFMVYKEEHWNSAFHTRDKRFHEKVTVVAQCSGGKDMWAERMANDPTYWMNRAKKTGVYRKCTNITQMMHGQAVPMQTFFEYHSNAALSSFHKLLMDESKRVWAPFPCQMRIMPQQRACSILRLREYTRVLFVGDSLVRQLYLAFLWTLAGEESNFTAQPVVPWAPSNEAPRFQAYDSSTCTNDVIAYATPDNPCLHYFARDTRMLPQTDKRKICDGDVSLEFVYGGTMETENDRRTREHPGIRDARPTAGLVVMGFGMWQNFSADVVFPEMKRHVDVLLKNFPKPHVLWLGADAQHVDVDASPANVARFNADMLAYITAAGLDVVSTIDLLPVMLTVNSYDGIHYGPAVNRLKTQLILQTISEWPEQIATSQTEEH